MEDGTGLAVFAKAYPERLFDVGIAEGHAVSMAAGMAKQGMIPVFAVYSTFLQRSYDMLFHDVALQKLHVVLGVDRAGLVGADGETHHGCLDISYLTGIPGFTVLCPSSLSELRSMTRQALFEIQGPVALRYPRGGEGHFTQDTGSQAVVRLRDGHQAVLVSYGILINQVLDAAERLERDGISTRVVKLNRIAPLDTSALLRELDGADTVLVLENCFENGSIGQQIAALLAESGRQCRQVILQNLKDRFAPEGTVEQLQERFGLDADGVYRAVKEALSRE